MNRPKSMPLSGGLHDRAAARRRDDDWLAGVKAAADTRVLVVRSTSQVLTAEGRLGHMDMRSIPADAQLTLLGIDPEGRAVFVADADAHDGLATEQALADAFAELRAVGGTLPDGEAALAAQAIALVGWHRRHRFCGVCGSATVIEEAGHSRRCSGCGAQHFPRTDPAVIMMVTDGDRCVLSKRRGMRANVWTSLSGFVEPGETPEEAVIREVYEEVGLRVGDVEYFASQPWPFPLSLMMGFYAKGSYGPIVVDDELEDARWFTRAELLSSAASGEIAFPAPFSIAHFLVRTWLDEG